MELKPLKVSEVNSYISRIISNDVLLYNINIEGEISNCKYHPSGHIYFSLKDEKSRIRAIMFKENADKNDFILDDGMKIEISGYISVYEKDGSYQVYIKKARDIGKGKLYEEFEKLKEKLAVEGLFDISHKKEIPFNPSRIGIVTSTSGAAIRDLLTNIKRRNKLVDIIVSETLVQGVGSADSIINSIDILEEYDVDLIIIGRGGGSIEDLASFNDEYVARRIYKSKIPIISAVGHETDFTISDFVSDKRASTPSTAAELAVPKLDDMKYKLSDVLDSLIKAYELNRNLKIQSLDSLNNRLISNSPKIKLDNIKKKLESEYEKLYKSINNIIRIKSSNLDNLTGKLDALSPLKTLKRGYSIIEKDEKVIESVSSLSVGDKIDIILSDGKAIANIDLLEEK